MEATETLEVRVLKLERQTRIWRAMVFLSLLLAALAVWTSMKEHGPHELSVSRLAVHDEAGVERLILTADHSGGKVRVTDARDGAIEIQQKGGFGSVQFLSVHDKQCMTLEATHDGANITMRNVGEGGIELQTLSPTSTIVGGIGSQLEHQSSITMFAPQKVWEVVGYPTGPLMRLYGVSIPFVDVDGYPNGGYYDMKKAKATHSYRVDDHGSVLESW